MVSVRSCPLASVVTGTVRRERPAPRSMEFTARGEMHGTLMDGLVDQRVVALPIICQQESPITAEDAEHQRCRESFDSVPLCHSSSSLRTATMVNVIPLPTSAPLRPLR